MSEQWWRCTYCLGFFPTKDEADKCEDHHRDNLQTPTVYGQGGADE